MGTPTPDNEPVVGCALCFGNGGVLGEVQPKYITVTISGTRPAPQASFPGALSGNGAYRLQHEGACFYRLTTSEFSIFWDWSGTVTRVVFQSTIWVPTTFISLPGDLCLRSVTGNTFQFANRVSVDGVAKVTWSTDGL